MDHFDIPGLVAGFALSLVIGAVLYVYLTVGWLSAAISVVMLRANRIEPRSGCHVQKAAQRHVPVPHDRAPSALPLSV